MLSAGRYHPMMVSAMLVTLNVRSWLLPALAQERLIALVAEHLLDRNGEDRMAAGATDEFRANLARNVADAIDLLPKLVSHNRPSQVAANP